MDRSETKIEENNLVTFGETTDGEPITFTDNSVPGFVIEGMLGACITTVFAQLDYFNKLRDKKHPKHKELVQTCKGLALISWEEAQQSLECLKNMKDSSLKPKHRAYRTITKEFLVKLKAEEKKLGKAKRKDNLALMRAVKHITNWLNSTTIVMSSYADKNDIKEETALWQNKNQ